MNQDKIPMEYQHLPPEHSIPEEYPAPMAAALATKKSSAKRIIAMCLTGFVALQLLFTYFIPPTNEQGSTPSVPNIQDDPYYDPDYKLEFNTNISIRQPDEDLDLQPMTEPLLTACEKMLLNEYVLAAVHATDALDAFTNHSSAHKLNEIVMVWENGQLSYFDGQDLRDGTGVYIYFYLDSFYYVGKESTELYQGTLFKMVMLVSEKTANGDKVRMLTLTSEDIMLMSSLYYTDATYMETVFDDSYNAHNVERLDFYVGAMRASEENTVRKRVIPRTVLIGDLAQDAFVGDVQYYFDGSELSGDDTRLVPLLDAPKILFKLSEKGALDYLQMGLVDFLHTTMPIEFWDGFYNDPSIPGYVLGYEQFTDVVIRCEDYENKQQVYWNEVKDLNKALFTNGKDIEFWRLIQCYLDK